MQYCLESADTLGLSMSVLAKLGQALNAEGIAPLKVIWLNGANSTGSTVSLANLFRENGLKDITDLLFNTIDLDFQFDLIGPTDDLQSNQLTDTTQGRYILAVDGGIPTAFSGHTCMLLSTNQGEEVTVMEAVQMLAPDAAAVLAIGTCTILGDIPSSHPNPTGIVSVSELTGVATVNIPGSPTHPDWIVWTIAHLLSGETLQMDEHNRPVQLFGGTPVQKSCLLNGRKYYPGNRQPDTSSVNFQLTKVVWEPETARLKVEGKGITDNIVSIYNADSGTLLGVVPVTESGRWKFYHNDPSPIPLRLLAKSDTETVFSVVTKTPIMAN